MTLALPKIRGEDERVCTIESLGGGIIVVLKKEGDGERRSQLPEAIGIFIMTNERCEHLLNLIMNGCLDSVNIRTKQALKGTDNKKECLIEVYNYILLITFYSYPIWVLRFSILKLFLHTILFVDI